MQRSHRTILLTGATDGIGLETAKMLVARGHKVLLHGRSPAKLETVRGALASETGGGSIECHVADLSHMAEVEALAEAVKAGHDQLDVLINNAGVYTTPHTVSRDGLDLRFAVNTLAPYLLTKRLLPLMGRSSRVINLSSAAQAPVDPQALLGHRHLADGMAYAQSKLALTMWSRSMGMMRTDEGPMVVAVNPGSMLGSKMVQAAYGVAGGDLRIGAQIVCRAALSDEFATASGRYYDNDSGRFSSPHPDALDAQKCEAVIGVIEAVLAHVAH